MKSNYDAIETKDIITEYYVTETTDANSSVDLTLTKEKEKNKAWDYILYSFYEGQVFSNIIRNMPANLTFTVHSRSFHIVFAVMKDIAISLRIEDKFCELIMRADDINFYNKNNIFDLNITPEGEANYLIHEIDGKKAYVATFEPSEGSIL